MTDYFIPCDAHEGCVWVPQQQRLYFSTTRKQDPPRAGICYLDLSSYDLARDGDWAGRLDKSVEDLTATEWIHDANMANSLCLGEDGRCLYVAEQGDKHRLSQITRIDLEDQKREVMVDSFRGVPFNSLNKVKQTRRGHLVFSDPDYGFRQHFRPPPQLAPSLYVLPAGGELFAFDCGLEMPHGLGFSPDERTLYVTDTSDDGAHDDAVELRRRKSVHAFDFDPASGRIGSEARYGFSVHEGVPDGTIVTGDSLLVGGGDGVYVADLQAKLRGKIPLDRTAVNLTAVYDHLFVTADEGVYILLDWRTGVVS